MISAKLTVDADVLDAIADTARRSPGIMNTLYKRRVSSLKRRIVAKLHAPVPPPRYPIKWRSERQRRAFFATRGFGRGIPTQRTGALQDGYDVVLTNSNSGGILQLTNNVPYARFVVGNDAQPFHIDHWPQIDDVVIEFETIAFNELVEDWFTATDERAGVR